MFDCRCGKQFLEEEVNPGDVGSWHFPFVLSICLHSEVSFLQNDGCLLHHSAIGDDSRH